MGDRRPMYTLLKIAGTLAIITFMLGLYTGIPDKKLAPFEVLGGWLGFAALYIIFQSKRRKGFLGCSLAGICMGLMLYFFNLLVSCMSWFAMGKVMLDVEWYFIFGYAIFALISYIAASNCLSYWPNKGGTAW